MKLPAPPIIALLGAFYLLSKNEAAAFLNFPSSFKLPNMFLPKVRDNSESVATMANDMTDASMLMYTYADLRDLAKNGKIDSSIEKLPIAAKEVAKICYECQDEIKKELGQDAYDRSKIVRNIAKRQLSNGKNSEAKLVSFDDQFKDSSLVYAIGVDDARKRVTVAFRGTNSKTDMLTDIQAWLQSMPNDMKSYDDSQPNTVKVHSGFHNYLFKSVAQKQNSNSLINGFIIPVMTDFWESLREEVVNIRILPSAVLPSFSPEQEEYENEEGSKFDVIMKEVTRELNKRPAYELYVTGHSLGGALATLFAFKASSESNSIPKPVTCVSVASPFVGSVYFREAFKLSEQKRFIRHLRVSGEGDLITTLPFISINLALSFLKLSPTFGIPFKHVGVNLKLSRLSENMSYKFLYPKDDNKLERLWESSILSNLVAPWNALDAHMNYHERVGRLENDETLNSVTLADLYDDHMTEN